MAMLSGCDITNTRNQEPLRIRQISDLIQTDMEVIPLLGLRHGNADANSGSSESSGPVIILGPCLEEKAAAITTKSNALTQHAWLMKRPTARL